MLLYRILTVLVIAPLFFWVNLYANTFWFNAFWLALVALAAREWGNLLRWDRVRQWKFALVNTAFAFLGLLVVATRDPAVLVPDNRQPAVAVCRALRALSLQPRSAPQSLG